MIYYQLYQIYYDLLSAYNRSVYYYKVCLPQVMQQDKRSWMIAPV